MFGHSPVALTPAGGILDVQAQLTEEELHPAAENTVHARPQMMREIALGT